MQAEREPLTTTAHKLWDIIFGDHEGPCSNLVPVAPRNGSTLKLLYSICFLAAVNEKGHLPHLWSWWVPWKDGIHDPENSLSSGFRVSFEDVISQGASVVWVPLHLPNWFVSAAALLGFWLVLFKYKTHQHEYF